MAGVKTFPTIFLPHKSKQTQISGGKQIPPLYHNGIYAHQDEIALFRKAF